LPSSSEAQNAAIHKKEQGKPGQLSEKNDCVEIGKASAFSKE